MPTPCSQPHQILLLGEASEGPQILLIIIILLEPRPLFIITSDSNSCSEHRVTKVFPVWEQWSWLSGESLCDSVPPPCQVQRNVGCGGFISLPFSKVSRQWWVPSQKHPLLSCWFSHPRRKLPELIGCVTPAETCQV